MQELDIVEEILKLIIILNDCDEADVRCRKATCYLTDLLKIIFEEPQEDKFIIHGRA